MTKVSVLIPAYNAEKYISEAVESVLKQDFRDFEIIIINDASTDKTKKIIEKLAGKNNRIKLINLKKNKGRAGTLNAGLKKSRGEYIAFLDADDLMYKERLRKQAAFLGKNKDIDLVYGDMENFYEDGRFERVHAVKFEKKPIDILKKITKKKISVDAVYKILDKNEYIPSGSVMLRKRIFDSGIKLDENLRNSEDLDLWLQIIGKGFKIAKIPIIAFKYRKHDKQKSKNKEKMNLAKDYMIKKLKSGKYFKV